MVDSPSPARLRNRLVHSMASSLSRHSISAQPPMSSLASANGPSITVNFPSARTTLVACSTGARPPVASRTPALVASSMNFPISVMSSGLGGGIGAVGSPSVYPKNRIVVLLLRSVTGHSWRRPAPPGAAARGYAGGTRGADLHRARFVLAMRRTPRAQIDIGAAELRRISAAPRSVVGVQGGVQSAPGGLLGQRLDGAGLGVAAEQEPGLAGQLQGLGDLAVGQRHPGARGQVEARLHGAVVAEADPDTGVGAQQASLAHADDLLAAARQGAHDGGAATDVAVVADHHAGADAALDHATAEGPGVEVDEALVHHGSSGGQVRAEADPDRKSTRL